MDGNFTKIIYSDVFITINGLYVLVPHSFLSHFDMVSPAAYFSMGGNGGLLLNIHNPPHNLHIFKYFVDLERKILEYYKLFYNSHKSCVFGLANQLATEKIKVYKEKQSSHHHHPPMGYFNVVLKISGVWETINEIGITYKFLEMTSL